DESWLYVGQSASEGVSCDQAPRTWPRITKDRANNAVFRLIIVSLPSVGIRRLVQWERQEFDFDDFQPRTHVNGEHVTILHLQTDRRARSSRLERFQVRRIKGKVESAILGGQPRGRYDRLELAAEAPPSSLHGDSKPQGVGRSKPAADAEPRPRLKANRGRVG